MQKRPLAVVTMFYNERVMLPLWLKHYAKQVGAENCYIIDHGSDDGSTKNIGVNIVRLPRTPLDEWARAHTVRDFCAALFIGFQHVLYADADELVLPDPDVADTLGLYMTAREHPQILDLFGVDVVHVDGESEIDLARPISQQRRYVRPISTLCKATMISERLDWHIGFHCLIKNHRPVMRDLFLFHLAHCDDDILLNRQKKRNAAAPVGISNSHHAIAPEEFLNFMRSETTKLPRRSVEMRPGEPYFEDTKATFADAVERKSWAQTPDLWRLPQRFIGSF